jgi:hypothetical protein
MEKPPPMHEHLDEYFTIHLPMKELARHLVWIDDEFMNLLREEIRLAVEKEIDQAFEVRNETIATVVRKVLNNE